MPKHLIVTADDFGLSPQVNAAVERAHRDGILTAASLMVAAPAAVEAVAVARRNPGLRVGLHLALVEARPALPAAEVPSLVGPDGWFRRDTARFGAELFFSPRMRRQLLREVEAQFAAYAATGLPLDHVDAHQHFHLHPTVASAMIRVGRRHGMRSVRIPAEPAGIVRAVEPGSPRALPAVTAPWTRLLGARMRRAGCAVPAQVFGLSWTGAMTEARVAGLLDRLPDGVTEIYTHPALDGDYPGAALGYRYREELDALISPRVITAARRSGAALCGYGDLA
ncbi:hopanoid biosynthesis-associated protein HpnK [Lichenibacterium dinghuense]|uniref:hopanoid biosynthesis-associated protein HpnK n=1 Tax=Lichenibacterium dinghuense TaxID=2895977 RepID=UPI001F01A745|nr:hopanoid biosynthesis-associated protein HpnK [Lichenibacterium sp. 6Y81]